MNDVRRAASVWVAGVGAALLIVSAALFVAVHWDSLLDVGKLSIILGVSAVLLFGGRRLKRTLPATGSVLFHLGAFLLPVDLAAINLRVGLGWEQMLLAEGLLGVVAFYALALVDESSLLRIAASAAVVATALGVGANTPVPASVALAVCAAFLALWFPRSRSAIVWATVAGYMPVLALAFARLGPFPELGLPRTGSPMTAVVTGVLAATVLAVAARAERDVRVAFLSIGVVVATGSTAWVAADLPQNADLLAPFAAFVVIELIAFGLRRDTFWARPIRVVQAVWEALAALATMGSLSVLFFSSRGALRIDGLRFAFLALGWGFATLMHLERDRDFARFAILAAAFSFIAAIQLLISIPLVTAAGIVVIGGLLLEGRNSLTDVGAVLMLVRAASLAAMDSALGFLVATVAAGLLVRRVRTAATGKHQASLVISATLILAHGAVLGAAHVQAFPATLAFVGGCWLIGNALDFRDAWVAFVPRVAAVASLATTSAWTPYQRLALASSLVTMFALDSVRLRVPMLAYGAVIPLQVAVFDVGVLAGVRIEWIGVVLCVAGILWAGLSTVVDRRWRAQLLSAALAASMAGTLLASHDAAAFGTALIIVGGVALGIATLERNPSLAAGGGALVAVGTSVELAAAHVSAAEAYVAAVACYLIAIGVFARRTREISSWVAYAPAIALFGATALVERIVGGPGWHSLVAGATGVIAVAVGGDRRLAGPLFAGTALLASVVGFESMAVAATVPTWGWLAIGGSALLATGVVLERKESTPLQAGRRVVDVIASNFN